MNAFYTLIFALFVGNAALPEPEPPVQTKWYTWEEAAELQKTAPRKIMVDVYTDWCGWCKKMDRETFDNPRVAKYLNEHFYPVKFDAEQRETIQYDGHDFIWQDAGRNGIHMLAYALLDGQMSYPTVVFLNEKMERVTISKGYKKADRMMNELRFIKEEAYTTMTLEKFLQKD